MIYPELEKVRELAQCGEYKRIPVSTEIYSDSRTPIEVLRTIKHITKHCYILESVEDRTNWGRYTFLGYDPTLEITCRHGHLKMHCCGTEFSEDTNDPAKHIRKILADNKSPKIAGMVVYGQDKLDEISMSAPTTVCEIRNGEMKSYEIKPEDFGLTRCAKEDLTGGTPEDNARITREILAGEKGPKRDAAVINAGAAIYVGGKADTMAEGIATAQEMIDSGAAKAKLEEFVTKSNENEEKKAS